MNLPEETREKLNELLSLSIDSYEGLEQAAERVDDLQMAKLLRGLAEERRTSATNLQHLLESAGESASASGSMIRRAQRWWLGVRARDETASAQFVGDAAQTDEKLARAYDQVLTGVHAGDVRELLNQQRTEVKKAQLRLQILREVRELVH